MFKPIWKTHNLKKIPKAVEYVRQITDQTKLGKIAADAPSLSVTKAAFANLTDVAILSELAQNANETISKLAVGRIDDQQLLHDLVLSGKIKHSSACEAAVKRMTDQKLLIDIAMNGHHLGEIKKQDDLAEIVLHAKDSSVKKQALKQITRTDLLLRICEEGDSSVAKQAIEHIGDQKVLAKFAKHGNSEVIKRIDNEEYLADIAMHSSDAHCRQFAASKIRDPEIIKALVLEAEMDEAFVKRAITILDEEKDLRELMEKYRDTNPEMVKRIEQRIAGLPTEEQKRNCRAGKHEWILVSHVAQKYQYGSSYSQYKCMYCNATKYDEDNGY